MRSDDLAPAFPLRDEPVLRPHVAAGPSPPEGASAGADAEDLLLFRAVEDPARRALACRFLATGFSMLRLPWAADSDLWELYDAAAAPDEEAVAVAATHGVEGAQRVTLSSLVVAAERRGRGIGQRMLEELADALRARGAMVLETAVPVDSAAVVTAMQRVGFRPCSPARAGPASDKSHAVWFDLEL